METLRKFILIGFWFPNAKLFKSSTNNLNELQRIQTPALSLKGKSGPVHIDWLLISEQNYFLPLELIQHLHQFAYNFGKRALFLHLPLSYDTDRFFKHSMQFDRISLQTNDTITKRGELYQTFSNNSSTQMIQCTPETIYNNTTINKYI